MSTNQCCRTCQYCCIGQVNSHGICRLRRITVHPELALVALCHHWTPKAPSLPTLQASESDSLTDLQLEFNRALVEIEK